MQPWLPLYREPCASFSADAQSFFAPCSFGRFLNVSASQWLVVFESRVHATGSARSDLLFAASHATSQRRRFRVRAAFFAAAERELAERCLATRFACLDNACLEAEKRLSRLSARFVALDRFGEGFLRRPARPFVRSRFAWRFVCCLPRFGGANFTPARRALDRPMAIACSGDRAPCSPSRMCSISSRTNSPAWVEGDLPSRSSSRARSIVSSSGITKWFRL